MFERNIMLWSENPPERNVSHGSSKRNVWSYSFNIGILSLNWRNKGIEEGNSEESEQYKTFTGNDIFATDSLGVGNLRPILG